MAKVIISELWIFPCLADIHRHPAPVCQKFRPAMVAFDGAFVPVGWNGSANGKTRRNTNAARQSNEIGVEIGAVTGAHITCVLGVAATPAGAGLVVAHAAHDMIVQSFRSIEIVSFSGRRFLSERSKGFVNRYQFLWTQ